MPGRTTVNETFESMQDGFFSFDRGWHITYLNRRASEMIGKAPGEVVGQVLWEALPTLVGTPADAILRRTMELRLVQHAETHGIVSGGWYHVTSYPTDDGISAYWQDITECKRIKGAQLVKIAIHDDLTGLYNRFFFDAIIRGHMEVSDRYGVPLSMAMLRPDGYRALRKEHGRAAAEPVIRLVAQTVRNVVRDPDLLFRFGDDEFGILMPHTDLIGAAETAEKIREAVERGNFPEAGRQTVSLGVAERLRAESYRHWYRRLDETLYNATQAGSSRVAIWDRYDRLAIGAAKLGWQKEWESGNPAIDSQHRELVDLANRLIEAGNRRRAASDLISQVKMLETRIAEHFQYEDGVLAAVGYPDQASRSDQHKRLLGKSRWAREACEAETVRPESLVSYLLDDVILEHLIDTDDIFHYARNQI